VDHEHIAGSLSKQISFQPVSPTSSAPDSWFLEVFYNLDATITEDVVPATALNAGSFNATVSAASSVTAFLIPQSPSSGISATPWVEQRGGNFQNKFSGVLNMPSSVAAVVDTLTWTSQATENGTETPFALSPFNTGPIGPPLDYQAYSQSAGTLWESVVPPGPTSMPLTAWFTQQTTVTDRLIATPSLQLVGFSNSSFKPSGGVTYSSLPVVLPGTGSDQVVGRADGTVQYADQESETILMPDGSTQMLTQNAQDLGSFVCIITRGG
jgi:hypothetical protein